MDDFLQQAQKKYGDSDLIKRAYEFAKEAHKDARRMSGEPYIIHPIGVATILMDFGMDEATIAAALLHDVVEDTPATFKLIRENFGEEVERLVKSVSKINRIKYTKKEIVEFDSLKRMFIAMSRDVRVIMIKLADRLHNIRTVGFLPHDRRIKFCSETMNLFVPLAERVGLNKIKNELEDTCFKYLNPKDYEKVKAELERKYTSRTEKINKIDVNLKDVLKANGIDALIQYRFKHLYSLYQKAQLKGTGKIYDAIAFRIVVKTVPECYRVLGLIHSVYRPVPGRIKDYIASPKSNGYQSLHTTVLMKDGTPFEVQIRTEEMHKFCEFGVAAHWCYKGGKPSSKDFENSLNAIRQMVEEEKDIRDSASFIKALKMDLTTAEIWVFTPKYKPISLPIHSTPVDFAYAIHSDIGNACKGAKVNGRKVLLSQQLETGDVVEILTGESKAPSRDWLSFVASSHARSMIREYFKKSVKPENVEKGRKKLEEALSLNNIQLSEFLQGDIASELRKKYLVYSFNDMFASIEAGGINPSDVVAIYRQLKKSGSDSGKAEDSPVYLDGTHVSGVKLAHCCAPVPGDKIFAIGASSGTITVHHADCNNLKMVEKDRLIEATWKEKLNPYKEFDAIIKLGGKDEDRMLSRIVDLLYAEKVKMSSISARLVGAGKFEFVMTLRVRNLKSLNALIAKFKQFKNVQYVNRLNLNS